MKIKFKLSIMMIAIIYVMVVTSMFITIRLFRDVSLSLNLDKKEITSGMNEMANGADHINNAVNHVSEISVRNRDAINTLIKEVSRFKVE